MHSTGQVNNNIIRITQKHRFRYEWDKLRKTCPCCIPYGKIATTYLLPVFQSLRCFFFLLPNGQGSGHVNFFASWLFFLGFPIPLISLERNLSRQNESFCQ